MTVGRLKAFGGLAVLHLSVYHSILVFMGLKVIKIQMSKSVQVTRTHVRMPAQIHKQTMVEKGKRALFKRTVRMVDADFCGGRQCKKHVNGSISKTLW